MTTFKDYELRLTTRATIKLEQALGKNLISLFVEDGKERIPMVGEIVFVLYYALNPKPLNIEAVYDLYDEYLEEGGSQLEMVSIIIELFKDCGIIPKEEDNKIIKNV